MNSPKPLYKYLTGKKGDVADLVTQAKQLHLIDVEIRKFLDQPLTDHCQVAGFKEGVLTLITDSPAWASRLHFYIPTLITELKQNTTRLQGLNKIVIQVQPEVLEPVPPPQEERILPDSAGKILAATADSVDSDALQQALQRLARHSRNKD